MTTETHTPNIRCLDGRNVEIEFGGRWMGLATVGAVQFGSGTDSSKEAMQSASIMQDQYDAAVAAALRRWLAAPTLLEALEEAEPALQAAHYGVVGNTVANSGVTREEVLDMTFSALQKARAAIAQARGEEAS